MSTPKWNITRLRWEDDCRINGKRYVFSSSASGKNGLAEIRRKKNAVVAGESDKATWRVRKCFDAYLEYVKSTTSYANYDQREQYGRLYILPNIEHKRISAVTAQDWQDCISLAEPVKGRPLSRKTLMNMRSTIIDFCRYAERSRMIDDVPTLTVPRNAPKLEKEILHPHQLQTVFGASGPWYANAWKLQLALGLRPGETIGIKRDDVDLKNNIIYIRRAINTAKEITPGKNKNAQRGIVMYPIAREIVDAQLDKLSEAKIITAWLFPDRDGSQPSQQNSYHQWTHFRKTNKITLSLYNLRHTYYSLLKSDVPEDLLKITLGQSAKFDANLHYGHEVFGDRQKAAKMIGKSMAKHLTNGKRWNFKVESIPPSGSNDQTAKTGNA